MKPMTTILHHERTHLLDGSRIGPSIVPGTNFNQFKWYNKKGLVRDVQFTANAPPSLALFTAYEDLLNELYPNATADDMRWDYLKLELPNKRSVACVLNDGSWTPAQILKDLPSRSMRLFLRCRYIPPAATDSETSSSDDDDENEDEDDLEDADQSMIDSDPDLQDTPEPKARTGSKYAVAPVPPDSPFSEDELSVNTGYLFPPSPSPELARTVGADG